MKTREELIALIKGGNTSSEVLRQLMEIGLKVVKTAQQFTDQNPILAVGQEGYESDTGKKKIGDGVRRWGWLDYASDGGGSSEVVLIPNTNLNSVIQSGIYKFDETLTAGDYSNIPQDTPRGDLNDYLPLTGVLTVVAFKSSVDELVNIYQTLQVFTLNDIDRVITFKRSYCDDEGSWTQWRMDDYLRTYSQSEQLVGYWDDGKPIYEKVIPIGRSINGFYKNILTSLHIDTPILARVVYVDNGDFKTSGTGSEGYLVTTDGTISVLSAQIQMDYYGGDPQLVVRWGRLKIKDGANDEYEDYLDNVSASGAALIRYTKTTD